ncbi:MAG: hypothetical protein AAB394_00115 [Patescibacteria group bacterium]
MAEVKKDKKRDNGSRREMEALFLKMNEDIGRRAELGLREAHFQYVIRGGRRKVFG